MLALYAATDGDHWKNHEGWLGPPGTECDWHAVGCGAFADALKTVTSLELQENKLNGTIPGELDQLPHLEWLSIFGNHLSGKMPEPLVQRSLSGSLSINAEAALLTDVSEIDFEVDPLALWCGRERVVLRADHSAYWDSVVWYQKLGRNVTSKHPKTFCQVKQARIFPAYFASLAWLLDKNDFYLLRKDYSRGIIDATPTVSTRVKRKAKTYEVVEWGGGRFELWVIQRAIESTVADAGWASTRSLPDCPIWKDGEIKESTAKE